MTNLTEKPIKVCHISRWLKINKSYWYFMLLLTYMSLWQTVYLLRIAMAHVVKGSMSFIMIFFYFNHLKL